MEGHAVEVEGLKRVRPHDAGIEPATKDPGGVLVLVEALGLVAYGELDVDGVVGTPCRKPGPFGTAHDVVGGRDDSIGIHAGRVVADSSERF